MKYRRLSDFRQQNPITAIKEDLQALRVNIDEYRQRGVFPDDADLDQCIDNLSKLLTKARRILKKTAGHNA